METYKDLSQGVIELRERFGLKQVDFASDFG